MRTDILYLLYLLFMHFFHIQCLLDLPQDFVCSLQTWWIKMQNNKHDECVVVWNCWQIKSIMFIQPKITNHFFFIWIRKKTKTPFYREKKGRNLRRSNRGGIPLPARMDRYAVDVVAYCFVFFCILLRNVLVILWLFNHSGLLRFYFKTKIKIYSNSQAAYSYRADGFVSQRH